MKKLGIFGLILLSLGCQNDSSKAPVFQGGTGVVYGYDSRQESEKISADLVRKLSPYSVALVENKNLVKSGNKYEIVSPTFGETLNLCPEQRFVEQRTGAFCSGLLIDEKHVLTAGHCVLTAEDCKNTSMILGYEQPLMLASAYKTGEDRVFQCKKIIKALRVDGEWDLHSNLKMGADFAILELDRAVTKPFKLPFNTEDNLREDDSLFVIGYPAGIPKKYTAGSVLNNDKRSKYIVTDLDTFGGNSGSPVFNGESGVLEGILIDGATDFVTDSKRGCRMVNKCKELGRRCEGEQVYKISRIRKYLQAL